MAALGRGERGACRFGVGSGGTTGAGSGSTGSSPGLDRLHQIPRSRCPRRVAAGDSAGTGSTGELDAVVGASTGAAADVGPGDAGEDEAATGGDGGGAEPGQPELGRSGRAESSRPVCSASSAAERPGEMSGVLPPRRRTASAGGSGVASGGRSVGSAGRRRDPNNRRPRPFGSLPSVGMCSPLGRMRGKCHPRPTLTSWSRLSEREIDVPRETSGHRPKHPAPSARAPAPRDQCRASPSRAPARPRSEPTPPAPRGHPPAPHLPVRPRRSFWSSTCSPVNLADHGAPALDRRNLSPPRQTTAEIRTPHPPRTWSPPSDLDDRARSSLTLAAGVSRPAARPGIESMRLRRARKKRSKGPHHSGSRGCTGAERICSRPPIPRPVGCST